MEVLCARLVMQEVVPYRESRNTLPLTPLRRQQLTPPTTTYPVFKPFIAHPYSKITFPLFTLTTLLRRCAAA
jgi:hypothetical protein